MGAGRVRATRAHPLPRPRPSRSDDRHATVTGNVYVALSRRLHATGFRTLTSAVPVVIDDCVLRPDVFVVCDDVDADPCVKRAPVLVVEILTPSTATFNCGEKFAAYRLLPSLREYLLIDPETRRCDLFRVDDEGLRLLHPAGPGDEMELVSVGMTLAPEQLWDEVSPA